MNGHCWQSHLEKQWIAKKQNKKVYHEICKCLGWEYYSQRNNSAHSNLMKVASIQSHKNLCGFKRPLKIIVPWNNFKAVQGKGLAWHCGINHHLQQWHFTLECWFKSWLLSFRSRFLLLCQESSWQWPKCLGLCQQRGRSGWGSWFPAWPNPKYIKNFKNGL